MALNSSYYSLSEFFEYLKPANLAYREISNSWHWIFWNQEYDESQELGSLDRTLVYQPPISERIKDVLHKLIRRGFYSRLVQFWAAKMRGDRRFLTTSNQPFALRWFSKRRCSYRKQCMSQDIYISGEGDEKEEGKEQFGPVGRAFLNQLPESTPNLKYYSLQEFPLRDHARLALLSNLTALPVFEVHDLKTCVGVLELFDCGLSLLDKWEQELKAVGLTFNPRRHIQPDHTVQQDLWEKIKQAFTVVAHTHPLALALVFTPSRSCGNDECCQTCSDLGLLQLVVRRSGFNDSSFGFSSCYFDKFIKAHVAFHLQEGKGVAGKALTSRKSYFCRNICDLSITEYPLVHYARDAGLNLSFSICMQVGQSENDHLILEFFLLPGNYGYNYTCSLLESLLTKLKQQFQSCRIVTEDAPGEEVPSKVINSPEDDEIDHLPVIETSTLPPTLRIWRYDLLSGDPFKKLDYQVVNNSTYSVSEFLEYVKPVKLTYWCNSPKEGRCFVFWSKENDESQAPESPDGTPFNNCSISERIKHVLQRLQNREIGLTQFWSHKRGSRCFLTTANQPFALGSLKKNYCSYRKHCMNLNIYTFEEGDEEEKQKEQLCPVGRAFCNRQLEWNPNVNYTPKEFPQWDLACLCFIRNLIVVPVFKARELICVGVLEILDIEYYVLEDYDELGSSFFKVLAEELSKVGLTSNYCYSPPDFEGPQDSWKEIEQLFKMVAQIYPLHSALAFVPLRSCGNDECCHNSSDLGFLKLAFFEYILGHYLIRGHKFFNLQNGKGVSGKAFASQKSLFCKNICDLSITEYPYVHIACEEGLTLSFAIFLQTTQSDNDPLVLEFFLLPGNNSYEHTYSLLGSLLTTVKQHLQSFRIASEDIQEVFPRVKISSNDDEVDRLRIIQNSGHSSGLQMLQNDTEMNQPDFADQHVMLEGNTTNFGKHVFNVEGDVSVTHTKNKDTTTKSKRQGKGKKLDISYDDLKQHFGKPLDEVAARLGVSRSTMKRIRKKHGIIKWPFHEKNKGNYSLFEMKNTSATPQGGEGSTSVSGRNPPCPSFSVQENVDAICQVTPHCAVTREARTVTIKASYGELPMIKFILSFTSKLAELDEEVAKRLKLKVGSFSMMYHDEDNDPISITCDSDLQLCMETMTSSGKSTIKMSVLLNSN